MQYHIARNGQQAGTFSEEDVRSKLLLNEFSPSDLCWTEGMVDWQPLSERFAPAAAPESTDTLNPYAPPQAPIVVGQTSSAELASRGARLAASLLNGLVMLACSIPLGIGTFLLIQNINRDSAPSSAVGPAILIGVSALLLIVLFIYNLYLLATRGQSLGKKWMAIRIVSHPDGSEAGGVKTIVLRGIVSGLIGSVPVWYLGNIYSIVDICFIFREDRRCIHDLIAGTQVVKGHPPGF